jgi:hypothetical protein
MTTNQEMLGHFIGKNSDAVQARAEAATRLESLRGFLGLQTELTPSAKLVRIAELKHPACSLCQAWAGED